jgi:hypothetical protein
LRLSGFAVGVLRVGKAMLAVRRERDALMAMETSAGAKAGDHFFPLRGVGLFGRARPKRAVVARLGE